LSRTGRSGNFALAAATASEPKVALRPSGAWMTPLDTVSWSSDNPQLLAAVATSRARAAAAANRAGLYSEVMLEDPPVSCPYSNSGRASASGILMLASGMSISSAINIGIDVVKPCPTSARGSGTVTVSSSFTVIWNSSADVGAPIRLMMS